MAQFPDVKKAVSAVQEVLHTPHGPHIQLLDDHMTSRLWTQPASSRGPTLSRIPSSRLAIFRDNRELQSVSKAAHRLIRSAIAMDGTCTGEHGVGIGKTEHLVEELGKDTVELLKTVKRAVDPLNSFNPGKLYPESKSKQDRL